MKTFLKITWAKVILFVILIIAASFIPKTDQICVPSPYSRHEWSCGDENVWGIGHPSIYGEQFSGDVLWLRLQPVNLIINIAIYYFLSSLLGFLWQRAKKKKPEGSSPESITPNSF